MFDNYGLITGAELNELLDSGYTIASDGALLPPGTIEQQPDYEPLPPDSYVDLTSLIDDYRSDK